MFQTTNQIIKSLQNRNPLEMPPKTSSKTAHFSSSARSSSRVAPAALKQWGLMRSSWGCKALPLTSSTWGLGELTIVIRKSWSHGF